MHDITTGELLVSPVGESFATSINSLNDIPVATQASGSDSLNTGSSTEITEMWNREIEAIFKLQSAEPVRCAKQENKRKLTLHRLLTSDGSLIIKREQKEEKERRK